jgi:hypothetical protein
MNFVISILFDTIAYLMMIGFLFIRILLLSATTVYAGWAPTKAPKWYKNYPPWWISKVDDAGYKDNLPVTVVPIQPIQPIPKAIDVSGHVPKKIIEQIEKGRKEFLDFPNETPNELFDDKNGNNPTASLKENGGGQLWDTIMHANDHSETRKDGKKSPELAVLDDPVFQNQEKKVEPMLIELKQQRHHLRGAPPLAPPHAYNVGQANEWVTVNNKKEEALKNRVGQQIPLWDSYWHNHPDTMPSLQSSNIQDNVFLRFRNSPFDLFKESRDKTYVATDDGDDGDDGENARESGKRTATSTTAAPFFEDDSNW